jgi:tetratricopeptide (TPR) repeat protein
MKPLLLVVLVMAALIGYSQDINVLVKEAENLEKTQKEPEALEKYKQVLVLQPDHLRSLVKATELNVSISRRDDKNKRLYIESAYSFAKRAWNTDSTQPDAGYAMSLANWKMTEIEPENKKIVAYARDMKLYADKALAINANHAKANYMLGKWNYEMTRLSGIKKALVKMVYGGGGMAEASYEEAIKYLEKCKAAEPYFVANYMDLAKAYKENRQPAPAIEVLNRLVKLPTRISDDVALKAEGTALLASMQ